MPKQKSEKARQRTERLVELFNVGDISLAQMERLEARDALSDETFDAVCLALAGDFDESKHPRDGGKFTSGGGGGGGGGTKKKSGPSNSAKSRLDKDGLKKMMVHMDRTAKTQLSDKLARASTFGAFKNELDGWDDRVNTKAILRIAKRYFKD